MRALSDKVGTLEIAVSPPDAALTVDGEAPSKRGPLRFVAGPHTVAASRPGYQPVSLKIELAGGETRKLVLTLEAGAPRAPEPAPTSPPAAVVSPPASSVAPPSTAAQLQGNGPLAPPSVAGPPPPRAPGRSLKIAGLTVGIAGVGAVVAGIVFGADALAAQNDVVKTYDPARERTGKNDQLAEAILLGVGGAAVVTGVVLIAVGARQAKHARASSRAEVMTVSF
jgi:hypothetical protein